MSGSARLCRFLTFCVKVALEGESAQLNQYRIGLEVFDKPESFDPAVDPIVRVEAGRLRQKLQLYYSSEGVADEVRIRLAKRGYAAQFERAAAEAVAAITEQPAGSAAATARQPQGPPAVAVLPFTDLSPDHDQEALCDGLTVELINLLSGLGGLRVVSPTSAFQFKGKAVDIREVGRHLNAQAVVEGSLRKYSEEYRVAAQLNDVSDGFVLWAGSYTWRGELPFAMQEELASAVVTALRSLLPLDEASPA